MSQRNGAAVSFVFPMYELTSVHEKGLSIIAMKVTRDRGLVSWNVRDQETGFPLPVVNVRKQAITCT